jgi:hypothetical protein
VDAIKVHQNNLSVTMNDFIVPLDEKNKLPSLIVDKICQDLHPDPFSVWRPPFPLYRDPPPVFIRVV